MSGATMRRTGFALAIGVLLLVTFGCPSPTQPDPDPPAGTLDTSFGPGSGASGIVNALALQGDGKILIGGNFSLYKGAVRGNIARVNSDGSADAGFLATGSGANSSVYAITVLGGGDILIGGLFSSYNGTSRDLVARLDSDGALDSGFAPPAGTNNLVRCMALPSGGDVLIGGTFTQYGVVGRDRLARVDSSGALVSTFPSSGSGASGEVAAMAVLGDGDILIGGYFAQYNATGKADLARLNSDGTLDGAFPAAAVAPDSAVLALASLGTGKILIGGTFTFYGGVGRNRIARLNADGSLDAGFDPGLGADNDVWAIAVQGDGKILIGGDFTSYDGTARNRLARLNADGSLDTTFDPGSGADSTVFRIAVQGDGRILIAGAFTEYDGTPRNRIARIWD